MTRVGNGPWRRNVFGLIDRRNRRLPYRRAGVIDSNSLGIDRNAPFGDGGANRARGVILEAMPSAASPKHKSPRPL